MTKQFALQSYFYVSHRHANITTKGLIFLMNVLPDEYICPLRKKEGTVKCTDLTA